MQFKENLMKKPVKRRQREKELILVHFIFDIIFGCYLFCPVGVLKRLNLIFVPTPLEILNYSGK